MGRERAHLLGVLRSALRLARRQQARRRKAKVLTVLAGEDRVVAMLERCIADLEAHAARP